MSDLLTAAQMRAIEQAAIEGGEVTGLELMERAGQGVVDAVFEEWPELAKTAHRAVVLCGPGNNGGDGFVIARLLNQRGWEVEVFLYGDAGKLPPDARVNYERWGEIGGVSTWNKDMISAADAELYVDAVFGAGLARAPSDEILEPLVDLYTRGMTIDRLVAVDAPTGLCMDSGRSLSERYGAVHAWLTVTFHLQRPGHFLDDGPGFCGKLAIVDIGLRSDQTEREAERTSKTAAPNDINKWPTDHKYDHGHAVILSGPPGRGGAARLAARGALRIGAGLVTVACPEAALAEHAAQLTAIMCRPFGETGDLVEFLSDERLNAVGLGPGLGTGDGARALITAVLAAGRSTVLDADALTAHADDPQALFDQLHDRCVLTPHGGEFARLFPDLAEKLAAPATTGPAYSKVDATREAAARTGCTVLFKGADTVIASPDGRAAINSAQYDRAAPWLATAGSGDVLTGFITGLLARGFPPKAAAEAAAWLHVECALSFGPGLIAEDLPEELPKVFRALGL